MAKTHNLLGSTAEEIYHQFGYHRPKWSSTKRQLKSIDEPIEYCIDEKEIENPSFKCQIAEFELLDGRVNAITISENLIK